MFKGHLGITLRVIGITLTTLLIFGGGGYLLDQLLSTKPMLMIVGLVLSFPITQVVIFKKFQAITDTISKK